MLIMLIIARNKISMASMRFNIQDERKVRSVLHLFTYMFTSRENGHWGSVVVTPLHSQAESTETKVTCRVLSKFHGLLCRKDVFA